MPRLMQPSPSADTSGPLRPSRLVFINHLPKMLSLAGAHRGVQCHRLANERLQRLFVDLVAFKDVDGAPRTALEASVEKPRRILERRSLGEGHLDLILVDLARADNSITRPHR